MLSGASVCMHASPSTVQHRDGDRDTPGAARATVTFKAVAEDLLEDGGKVDELLGGVVDGLRRVFLQQGLH